MSDILDGHQKMLMASLEAKRRMYRHPGTLGSVTEGRWLKVLKDHLPMLYQADSAFVIDSRGQSSQQIDIVIFDHQYSPVILNDEGQKFVPAEGVYAVLEVKQDLSLDHIRYAADKAASVRMLHRTSARIPWAKGTMRARRPGRILAGILALESTWKPPFGAAFSRSLAGVPQQGRLDLGCALRDGAFEAKYSKRGTVSVTTSTPERSLVEFFFRLLRGLQSMATVPAMDYGAYLRCGAPPARPSPGRRR